MTFSGKFVPKSDISDDEIHISGQAQSLALIISLIDRDVLVKPKINSSKDLTRYMKKPPSLIVLRVGDDKVGKTAFLGMLEALNIRKIA